MRCSKERAEYGKEVRGGGWMVGKGEEGEKKMARLRESRTIVSCLLAPTVHLFSCILYAFLYLIYVCSCEVAIYPLTIQQGRCLSYTRIRVQNRSLREME